jgi:hypothetical protein
MLRCSPTWLWFRHIVAIGGHEGIGQSVVATATYITASDLRPTGDPLPTIDNFKNSAGDVWFCFRYNVFKNYPHDLKIV